MRHLLAMRTRWHGHRQSSVIAEMTLGKKGDAGPLIAGIHLKSNMESKWRHVCPGIAPSVGL
jgi:hypothetical protein